MISVATQPAAVVIVPFEIDAVGNEFSVNFTVNFDPAKLGAPQVFPGSGVPIGTNIIVNTSEVAQGRIGIQVNSDNVFAAGTRQLITISFNVAANAQIGLSPVTFGGTPIAQSVTGSGGVQLATIYQSGNIQIGSTAAGVSITGRVLTPDGRGLRNAVVVIIDSQGAKRFATTSSFGIFQFDEIGAGDSYIISVNSKRYRFAPRLFVLTDTIDDMLLIGLE